jgi:murein DD-endopeptidase MepM/ murein hydrolase activator NlpD
LRIIDTNNPKKRRNLRAKITSIATGLLIFLLAGILQRTYKTGSIPQDSIPGEQTSAYSETLSIANIYSGTISRNSNLYTELLSWQLPKSLISGLTSRFSRLFDLRGSKPGDKFKLFMGPGDSILAFEYITSDWKRYRLDRDGNDYVATVNEIGLDRKVQRVEGKIESSLWDALLPVLPDMEIFTDLADIFGSEIDFLTEPRVGDKFSLVFETFEKDSVFVRPGKILAAQYFLGGVPHRAFLFTDASGHSDYYDERGYSLRKSFLKSPLNYRRISSRFSMSRFHPILKIYRPHLGVDYAAASGTPVVSPSEGQIIFKGWRSGFGNYMEIRHTSNIVTCYGHLQGFARGLSGGDHVDQGQVIGFVGATGLATGPHLDFRIMKNGRFIDPLKMILPAALPVKDAYKPEFQQVVGEYLPLLDKPATPAPMQPLLAGRN